MSGIASSLRSSQIIKAFYPEEIVAFGFSLAIIIAQVVLIINGLLRDYTSTILLLLSFSFFLTFVLSIQKSESKLLIFLRSYLHIPYYGVIFTAFEKIAHLVNPNDWDKFLLKADLVLFRTDLSVFLEKFNYNFLTEVLTIAYVSYYVLPTISAVVFYLGTRGHDPLFYSVPLSQLRKFVLAIVIGWYSVFIFYLIFPAAGPDIAFPQHYHSDLKGLTFFSNEYLKAVGSYLKESNVRNTFPSMHFGILLIINYFAFKWKRKYFLFCTLPFGIGLGIATLYLRQHYLIDLIVALPVAIVCVYLSRKI